MVMKNNERNKINRRQFVKYSLSIGTAALLSSFPPLLFSKQANQREIRLITELKNPYGVAVSPNGLIYVADSGNYCIKIFDLNSQLIRTIGKPGGDDACLNFPQGVAVDKNGTIYTMDSNNGRIAIFAGDGEYIGAIGSIGGYPGAFYTPKGIFIHDNGNIYAANTRNHTIYIFDSTTHKLLANYGLLGEDPANLRKGSLDYRFRLPTDVAVTSNGIMYVVDSKHGNIKVLDQDGGFLFKFGEIGTGMGQFNFPEGIALDSAQNIFVCDTLNSRIQKFTSDGKFLAESEKGLFEKPTGICIDKNDTLYVVDSAKNVVKIFNWS